MTDILITREYFKSRDKQGEEHVETEAEIIVMHLPIEE